jgi:cell fate regulator YaaT (PSP1 superfamily)
MAALIEVSFKGNRREFFLWESDPVPPLRAAVIVEADRGEDLGRVHATGDAALHRSRGVPYGIGDATPERKAKRLATTDDVRRHAELRERDDDARRKAMERVRANALVMKVTDAEWQWDRKKLTFYFTAEKRVDFRTLVRELASMFRARIELKQIGVRDEAKRLDGIGRCGRQYCSASWLPELRPVSLGVAKDQRLSLNPTQISGACGRLMCSLRYEHEFYVQARKRFPKEGKTIQTTVGEERVVSNDIFRERVTLRSAEGETRVVALAELQRDLGMPASVAEPLKVSEDVIATVVVEEEFEELEALEEDVIEPPTVSPAPRSGAPAVQTPDADAGRRPHRRRGRRGGRRNRGGKRPGGQGGGGDGGSSK